MLKERLSNLSKETIATILDINNVIHVKGTINDVIDELMKYINNENFYSIKSEDEVIYIDLGSYIGRTEEDINPYIVTVYTNSTFFIFNKITDILIERAIG